MPWIDVPRVPGADRAVKARAQAGGQGRAWYSFRNATSPDEAEMYLFDEVGGWFGATADQFVEDLAQVTSPSLRVHVNSPGGSVFEGLAIANALRAHPANVTIQVDGLAASIASVIAMAGDRVEMSPQSMIMIHEASGMCLGDAAEMAKMAEVLDIISDNISDAYAAKAGGTAADWRAAMKSESWYKAADAVAAGLADEALPANAPAEDEPAEMHTRFDPAAYGYQGPVKPPAPKPGPPPAKPEPAAEAPTLVISIADVLDEQMVEQLRAAVMAAANTASPVHHTATEDRPWDSGPNEKRLPSPMTVKTAKGMYAWYDDTQIDGGELPKSACKLPHHEVSADGTPGAANLPGVRNALARLPQSDIPASQHDAVRRHLQAHLDDAAKPADDETPLDPQAVVDGPPAPVEEPDPEPDGWDEIVATLTTPAPDPWGAAFAHLTQTPASSATDA